MLNLWIGLRRFVDEPRFAATFYTLVETASRNGLDPGKYLLEAARHALQNPGAEALLPWAQAPRET